jgi:hypothetical protein
VPQVKPAAAGAVAVNRGLVMMVGALTGEVLYFSSIGGTLRAAGTAIGAAVNAIGVLGVTACAIVGLGIAALVVYVAPPEYAEPVGKGAAIIGGAAAGAAIGLAIGGPIGGAAGAVIGGLIGWWASK